MIDRRQAPSLGKMPGFSIPALNEHRLDSGIVLAERATMDRQLLRLDIVVKAGSAFQSRPMVAAFALSQLKEGCRRLDSTAIAETLDRCGAYLYTFCGMEYVFLSLLTPRKHFPETLTVLRDIYLEPVYPEKDLAVCLEQRHQRMLQEREQVQVVANLKMNELLFGAEHPYGRILQETDFDHFDTSLLTSFHRRFYRPANTRIVLTGDVRPEDIRRVEECFGRDVAGFFGTDSGEDLPEALCPAPNPSERKRWVEPRPESLQAALRFSLPLPEMPYEAFQGFKVLNTLLGGFYDSRLMKALRHRHGYTYNVASTHTVFRNISYLDITTQTGVEYADQAEEAVFRCLERLAAVPARKEELEMLRRYLYGEYARMLDGPFTLSDIYMQVYTLGMQLDDVRKGFETMERIDAITLRDLARTYFDPDRFYRVRIGGKDD